MLSVFSQDPKYMVLPILLKEIPHFLGAATIAIQTITQHLVGLADLELQWSKGTVPAEVTCLKLSQKPGKSQCTSMTFFTRP